jgi:hypothetical protein
MPCIIPQCPPTMKNSATAATTRPKARPAIDRNNDMVRHPAWHFRRVKPGHRKNANHLQNKFALTKTAG